MPDRLRKNVRKIRSRHDSRKQSQPLADSHASDETKQRFVFAMLILFLIGAGIISNSQSTSAVVYDTNTGSSISSRPSETLAQDYSNFSHTRPKEHADLMGRSNCVSCHRRNDSSLSPRLPVHKDCTGCHLVQFTARTSAENPICTICHTRDGLSSPNPPIRTLSGLGSFNAKFDHAQHMSGIESARPAQGCSACHTPTNRGLAQTIPARLDAHQNCYQCHSPGKQTSNFSSCGSCHENGRYSRTPATARAYRVGFSHSDHSVRKRLNCDSCHNVKVRGLPQAQQVTSILPVQHYVNPRVQSCKTCHNGKRAFGDTGPGFTDCVRCHKGINFRT